MKFKLFSSRLLGRTLTLSATQNGRTAGPVTLTDYGRSASAGGVAITVDRTRVQCAPDSVRFGVDLSKSSFDTPGPGPGEVYDPRLHDLIFLWNTGDTGTWSAPRNVLPEWNDKSRAKGPWFAHCYTKPGKYTVTLTVIEPSSGKTATDSVTIDVADPDDAYSGEKTICINPPGVTARGWGPSDALYFEWDPTQELINNQPWWNTINFSSDRRFLFDPNASYPDKIGFRFDDRVNIFNPYIGSAGTGRAVLNSSTDAATSAKMIYVENNYNADGPTMDFRVDRIDGRGTFDPTVEVPQDTSASGKAGSLIRSNKYLDLIISDCRASGFKNVTIAAYMTNANTTRPAYIHIDDTRVTDMGGQYGGVFLAPHDLLPDSTLTLSGTALVQNPDTIAGGSQHRAPLRENGQHKVNLRCCECFGQDDNNSGWKLCTTPSAEIGHIVNLDGVVAEGNYMPLHFQQNATQGIGRSAAINAIADGVVIIADYSSTRLVESYATGVTLRNVLGIVPNSPRLHSDSVPGFTLSAEGSATPKVTYASRKLWSAVGFVVSGTPPATTLAARCAVYNSTFVTDRSLADNGGGEYRDPAILFAAELTNSVNDNNVLDGPWPDNGLDLEPFSPLATETLWAPYCIGFKGYQSKTLVTEFATPRDAVISAAPLPGSPALGAALSGETAYFDITGKVRPVYPSIGAWEVR